MHVISRKPFNDAARDYPNDRIAIEEKADSLFGEASFLSEICNIADYEDALALMDELIDDYENNRPLIELLSNSIQRWEDRSEVFSEFNERINSEDPAVATLRLLMSQYQLGGSDLPEIGSKSLVSKILNQCGRQLTRQHIAALSERFEISPALFFK